MKSIVSMVSKLLMTAAALGVVAAASADDKGKPKRYRATLTGFSEVAINAPTASGNVTSVSMVGAISTTGRGTFRADVDEVNQVITYTLKFSGLEGAVTMSHLHFGQHHTTGGISVWLCGTTGNFAGPVGTPQCMPDVAISGTIAPANVVGPANQGIAAGEFDELVAAIRAGVVYANVHSTLYPPGEIRGQLF
jgi:hypothetical protein